MKILITGSKGLVGSHFVENYNGTLIILSPDREELDITNERSVENFFKLNEPDVVINFAAFTNVSEAEKQRNNKNGPCWITNVEGTAYLVKSVLLNQIYFIHISTDVVFSGGKENPGPYDEDSPTEENPNFLSWYGWTKKQAEKLVTDNLKNAAILRIANPVRAKYQNKLDYVHKILDLYDKNELYPFFDDQYLTLTYINEVTETLKVLLANKFSGIYHVSSTNIFTPYKIANLLIEKARDKKALIKPISIENFLKDNKSRYPQYGGLKVEKTQTKLNLKFMKWEEVIAILAKQLKVLE